MSRVKKWSTGSVGNNYPDHSERGNPNSRGLSSDGIPGVEGYIEEDRVLAQDDNRPIRNLAENDIVLENNISDLASEVDYGVLKNRYQDFKLKILPREKYPNPENPDELINISALRVHAGSSIINGQVTRIGNQRIIYFLKDDNSYLFPDYDVNSNQTVISLNDDLYDGTYSPVYSTLSSELPNNFQNYEIVITNNYNDGRPSRTTYFKMYRDWEDIVPFPPDSTPAHENINFRYDQNYTKDSEGYWLSSGGTIGTQVDDVTVKKDIQVKGKKILSENINNNEFNLVTDAMFFDNISWTTDVDETLDVKDFYVDEEENIYFIYNDTRDGVIKDFYLLPNDSNQADSYALNNRNDQTINSIFRVKDYIFIVGTNGYFKAFSLELEQIFNINAFNQSNENFRYVIYWQKKLWIATDGVIYSINYDEFDSAADISSYDVINFNLEIDSISQKTNLVQHITKLDIVTGNFLTESSLKETNHNYLTNSSFEKGVINQLPSYWKTSGSGSATITNGGAYLGNRKALLQKLTGQAYVGLEQEVLNEFTSGDTLHFSAYIKGQNSSNFELVIREVGANTFETTEVKTISLSDWERFNISHVIQNQESTVYVEIRNHSDQAIMVDAVQLELNALSDYTECFEYLFIGFEKDEDNPVDPPFAIIDKKRLSAINYVPGMYGNIRKINDSIFTGNNSLYFIDDKNVYQAIFLNDEDEYSRVSIKNITSENSELNFQGKIDRLTTIQYFDEQFFLGAFIKNEILTIYAGDENQDYEFEIYDLNLSPIFSSSWKENFIDFMGGYRSVPRYEGSPSHIEFKHSGLITEADDGVGGELKYRPNQTYGFGIRLKDQNTSIFEIELTMPQANEGPITVDYFFDKIRSLQGGQIIDEKTVYFEEYNISFALRYSTFEIEGLYSFSGNNISRLLRGNVYKINRTRDYVYIAREQNIVRSKKDLNILKVDDEYPLPSDPNYFHEWKLYDEDYKLTKFEKVYNSPIQFSDVSYNVVPVSLPADDGFKILPGSVRLKTSEQSEFGFSEDRDFIVDYENNNIIRSNISNLLSDSAFEYIDMSSSWHIWNENPSDTQVTFNKFYNPLDNEESFAEYYIDSSNVRQAAVYQIYQPSSLNVGDVYTFSIYVKSYNEKESKIVLSECEIGNDDQLFNGFNQNKQTEASYEITASELGQWKRIVVHHTINDSSSDALRVEVYNVSTNRLQLFMNKAKLERNSIATPWVLTSSDTRIDPGMNLFIDFIQYKELIANDDYEFDIDSRKIIFLNEIPNQNSDYYFDYKYEKIFNAHVFGQSIPRFNVTYDPRDDYFLYKNEGRIWAINQMMTLLSMDEENPMTVDYEYSYPRIDKIKIRNRPDTYGNMLYLVKGESDNVNPYGPHDAGDGVASHVNSVSRDEILNTQDNETLYAINVISRNFNYNDIYDRRVYMDSKDNKYYNISLYDQTLGYFPFKKDFLSTSNIAPLNELSSSKIVEIIKNFEIRNLEEIGAWSENYDITIRNKLEFPATTNSIFVDPMDGSDDNNGSSEFTALKTVNKAVDLIQNGDPLNSAATYPTNIVITNDYPINENININHNHKITIFAETYSRFRGALQAQSRVDFQGIQFENFNLYLFNKTTFYYCTFINSTVNNYYPTNVEFYNSVIRGSNNTFLTVQNTIFPSPFIHPYQRNVNRDDSIAGNPESVATSDNESISPGDSGIGFDESTNPTGLYMFERCLIIENNDEIVDYHLDEDESWFSEFTFNRCTIAKNSGELFKTNKTSQSILYLESILYNNITQRGNERKIFNSASNIVFQNSFIDFEKTSDSYELNFNINGSIFGRESCIGGPETDPGFVSTQDSFENYRLKTIANGYLVDSICVGVASDGGDLGAYDELRERIDIEVPQRLKSSFAFIDESVYYPIVINSEKITFTIEFKPTNSFNEASVVFDTRSRPDDEDYIVLAYNNNSEDTITNVEPDQSQDQTRPYTFKIIVSNKNIKYAVISPIEILSDTDYQSWHKVSFTVNFERTYNEKSAFEEKDKYQNIITFYHNQELAIESFLKNDLNRDEFGNLIQDVDTGDTNAWNFNNISRYITLGGTFDNKLVSSGYYSEWRIDNRFVDRKELEAWNRKIVPFNDTISTVNQNNLVRTFDSHIINEFWSLRTEYNVGYKGNIFEDATHKRLVYNDGELTWSLPSRTTNLLSNPSFSKSVFASVTTDTAPRFQKISGSFSPLNFSENLTITVTYPAGSPTYTDPESGSGSVIRFYEDGTNPQDGINFNSPLELYNHIVSELSRDENSGTQIAVELLPDQRIRFYTKTYIANSIQLHFDNGGDPAEMGFDDTLPETSRDWTYQDLSGGARRITGVKNNDTYEINGVTAIDLQQYHAIWLNTDKKYSLINNFSLGVSRIEEDLNRDEFIIVYPVRKASSQVLSTNIDYSYSVYIYDSDDPTREKYKISIVEDEVERMVDFEGIENIRGNFYKLYATIRVTDVNAKIGLSIQEEALLYIDAMQLERNSYHTTFIENIDTKDGLIEIDNSILRDDRGVIFFRFKPMFNYQTDRRHVLLEAFAERYDEENDIVTYNENKGFAVWYSYDAIKDRGIISFRTNLIEDEDSTEDVVDINSVDIEVVERFWHDWHSVAISYDFNTKRFVYWFDYFKNEINSGIDQYNLYTNLFIGKTAVLDYDNGQPIYKTVDPRSADIYVKDVIITNYPISDNETYHWIYANEFYKEGLFVNIFNQYRDDILSRIQDLGEINENTLAISSNINTIISRLDAIEASVDPNVDLDTLRSNQDSLISQAEANRIEIQINNNNISLNLDKINQNILDIASNRTDIDENTTNLSNEIASRQGQHNQHVFDLASTGLGYGASLIGIYDNTNRFAATTVQDALFELETRVQANEDDIASINTNIDSIESTISRMHSGGRSSNLWTEANAVNNRWNIADLREDVDSNGSNIDTLTVNLSQEISDREASDLAIRNDLSSSSGAGMIGIEDTNDVFGSSTVEAALYELAGTGRTTQTVKTNWDQIQTNISRLDNHDAQLGTINTNLLEIGKVKDGSDGSSWLIDMNLKAHSDRLDIIESDVSDNKNEIASNDSDISDLQSRAISLETGLQSEIDDRTIADNEIRSDLASVNGASLIGIEDVSGSYVATTVEGALAEIDQKLQSLIGSISWQEPVATNADLPDSDNDPGDARTVLDDGDGKAAQYVWNGSSWVKISDIDWGTASDVSYSNSANDLESTNVQAAIDELFERSVAPNVKEDDVLRTSFIAQNGLYYYDIQHDLKTKNISVLATNSSGFVVGVEEIERIDENTVRIWVDEQDDMRFTVFGVVNSYSQIISSWNLQGGMYERIIRHDFDTKNIMIGVYDINTGEKVGLDQIEILDNNRIRVVTSDNTKVLHVFILRNTSDTKIYDLNNWKAISGMYEAEVHSATGFDALYEFFNITSGKSIGVDSVRVDNGKIVVRKADNEPIRMVILK